MPASKREAAFQALLTALATVSGASVVRDEDEPLDIPAGGLITLRDGETPEPEALLSPLTYLHRPEAEIVVQVAHANAAARAAGLDTLLQAVEAAIVADTTLGGAVDYIQLALDDRDVEPVEGGAAIASATVLAEMQYESATALG